MSDTIETTTYEIETNRGTYRITVPSTWKVTYGPVSPGKFGDGGNALRIYEDEKRQRAMLTNVTSFRDISLPTLKLNKTVKGKTTWEVADEHEDHSTVTSTDKSWDKA